MFDRSEQMTRRGSARWNQELPSHAFARRVMGDHMIGLAEVTKHFGVVDPVDRFDLEDIPFSPSMLRACAKSHLLVADTGINIQTLRRRSWKLRMRARFDQDVFVHRTEQACWRLIRRHAVVRSFQRTWEEQCALLDQTLDLPLSARQVAYTSVLLCEAREEKLFEQYCVRTSDVDAEGNHVVVGPFTEFRLRMSPWPHQARHWQLGCSSARKPDYPRVVWVTR